MLLVRTATIVPTPAEADLIVVGPEAPLVAGFADEWRQAGKAVFGPGKDGARLEGSKAFLKDFLKRAGVPTARYGTFTGVKDALAYLSTMNPPYVVKTSGLAAGKGVLVTASLEAAKQDARDKLSGASFGEAGQTIVIEEGLVGEELSLFVICDGSRFFVLPPAQDFKRIRDNDEGPNTGGVGAYSPVAIATDELLQEVEEHIIRPTIAQLRRDAIDYRGVLYLGLMVTRDGPKVIEYNVRFGDPDSQVSLLRYTGDLAQLLMSAANSKLSVADREISQDSVVNVVLTAEGYPISAKVGDVISGIDDAAACDHVYVFEAGVTRRQDGEPVTSGGRVLNIAATGATLSIARERAYAAAQKIHFAGMQFRTDIAKKAAERQVLQ